MARTYSSTPVLSKVKIGSQYYFLKDADVRGILDGINDSYYTAFANAVDADGGLTSKNYVDTKIEAIKQFTIVVCPADATQIPAGAVYKDGDTVITGTMAASAATAYKIYLVKNSTAESQGVYVEWLTVIGGTEEAPTYTWEPIGDTKVDLSDYVKKTTTIAGIDLQDNIGKEELQTALGLEDLAYADDASGTVSTIDSIAMKSVTVSGNATVTTTSTAATLTKGDFKPEGSITGSAISGGSISVTVKDATTASDVTDITYSSYTPAGSISATENGSFTALKSATFGANDAGVQITGTISKPAITVNDDSTDTFVKSLKAGDTAAASFTEGTFTPNTPTVIDTTKFNGGSAATFTQGAKASLTAQTTDTFAKSGIKASVGTGSDAECLIFEDATTASAVTDRGTFTANGDDSFTANTVASIASGFYTAGTAASKAADTFSSEKLPVVDATASAVTEVSAELATTPVFTGDKFSVTTSSDTALKEVAFTGTAADVKFAGAKYLKQEINTATFTGTEATLGFEGTTATNAVVTGVTYDKADATAAYSSTVTPEVDSYTRTDKTVTVTPNA